MRMSASTLLASLLMLASILLIWSHSTQAAIEVMEDALEVRADQVFWDGMRPGDSA